VPPPPPPLKPQQAPQPGTPLLPPPPLPRGTPGKVGAIAPTAGERSPWALIPAAVSSQGAEQR
jgi:type III secretion protein C